MSNDKELLLIGTVHGDPDGASRLRGLLQSENPQVILVEVSPYGLAYRKKNLRRLRLLLKRRISRLPVGKKISWKEWGQVQGLYSRIRMPFEYKSSLRFSRDCEAVLGCIDLSSQSREHIGGEWDEMFSMENLMILLREPREDPRLAARKSYALAARLIREHERSCLDPYVRSWMDDPLWQRREAHLAGEIKRYFECLDAGLLAYVGGWQHLLFPTSAGTVCDRVASLRPRRVLLS